MVPQRVGGIITFKINGQQFPAKGNFSYNLGLPKREGQKGSDGVHYGYVEKPQIGYVEGEIFDLKEIDKKTLFSLKKVTVMLELSNGKMLVYRNAYYAGEGKGDTEEGKLEIKFEGDGEELQ